MKKLKLAPLFLAVPVIMSSCVVMSTHRTTGNPVGTKEGFVKSKNIGNSDAGIAAAAKKGGITKIATVDVFYYSNGKLGVKVTGE
ncbi:MAG: hypothetical protein SFY56_16520 [Bacteroidota bacterium]|nr:hypothetical protein [Bacteroidota bacterium]